MSVAVIVVVQLEQENTDRMITVYLFLKPNVCVSGGPQSSTGPSI